VGNPPIPFEPKYIDEDGWAGACESMPSWAALLFERSAGGDDLGEVRDSGRYFLDFRK